MSVGFARDLEGKETETKTETETEKPIPTFTSLEQWDPMKSTKMDTCAKICRHMLTRDDVPPIIFENGQAIFPQISDSPPGGRKTETKILIYQEFTSLRALLRNVTLHYLSI